MLGSSGWDLVFFIGGEEIEEGGVEVGEEEEEEERKEEAAVLVLVLALALAVAVAERLVGRDMKVIKRRRALSSERTNFEHKIDED